MAGARHWTFPEDGKLADNITHFARALRKAGMPVGTGRVLDAIRAVEAVGFTDSATSTTRCRPASSAGPSIARSSPRSSGCSGAIPQFMEHMMSLLMPIVRGAQRARPSRRAAERRAAEALLDGAAPPQPEPDRRAEEIEVDATLTFSADERLRQMDFEQMSAAELAAARRAIARLEPAGEADRQPAHPGRPRGRVPDWRGTMRAALRSGGDVGTWCCARAARAGRTSSCSATSPARCRPMRGCCCTSSMPPPTPRARAGRRCMPSPSAPG